MRYLEYIYFLIKQKAKQTCKKQTKKGNSGIGMEYRKKNAWKRCKENVMIFLTFEWYSDMERKRRNEEKEK